MVDDGKPGADDNETSDDLIEILITSGDKG